MSLHSSLPLLLCVHVVAKNWRRLDLSHIQPHYSIGRGVITTATKIDLRGDNVPAAVVITTSTNTTARNAAAAEQQIR